MGYFVAGETMRQIIRIRPPPLLLASANVLARTLRPTVLDVEEEWGEAR